MMLHNSHLKFYRTPAGPVPAGSEVIFRFRCDEAVKVDLHTWMGSDVSYPMTRSGKDLWKVKVTIPKVSGQFWYDFVVTEATGATQRYGSPRDQMGGEGCVYPGGGFISSYQLTVYDPEWKTPDFMHGGNIYQIFPDRFFRAPTQSVDDRSDRYVHENWNEDLLTDSDPRSGDNMALDFFGGTLNGIREKLSYLKDLGITILYINPIFRARSNHRYDTGDYTVVDPLLGTNEEFSALCDAAHEMGMSVMLDGVFSHTGEDSRYFNRLGHYDSLGACQGKKSPYYSWYTFRHFPNDYRCWWGIPSLPECRKEDPSYRSFIMNEKDGIARRWIRAGANGWRLDVADELSMDFLRELRKTIKDTDPNAVMLGEVWEDASNKVAYGQMRCYCTGDTLDSVMNYPLREAILSFVKHESSAMDLQHLIDRQAEVYPAQFRYSLMNLVGSHDRARVLNVLCGREGIGLSKSEQQALKLTEEEYDLAKERLKTCIDILCALPGCPTIYYGDEAGLTGGPDPFCRRPFPWGREDNDLQEYWKKWLCKRRDSSLLRNGLCDVEALDEDTLNIVRYFDKTDAFGNPAEGGGAEEFRIHRGK